MCKIGKVFLGVALELSRLAAAYGAFKQSVPCGINPWVMS